MVGSRSSMHGSGAQGSVVVVGPGAGSWAWRWMRLIHKRRAMGQLHSCCFMQRVRRKYTRMEESDSVMLSCLGPYKQSDCMCSCLYWALVTESKKRSLGIVFPRYKASHPGTIHTAPGGGESSSCSMAPTAGPTLQFNIKCVCLTINVQLTFFITIS